MQEQTEFSPWHIVEAQVARMNAFEKQIENLRGLLAEDWQLRLSRHETGQSGPGELTSERWEFSGNRDFSAC